jgi:ABC-type transport system involved in multi-copper enzyme maturation permease subunit
MTAIASIARYTFLQQMRNRLYLVVGFFAALILGVSLLFSALAPDQEVRVILDFGLAVIELFGLVAAVFGAVTLILEEMESRTLYLILTRPLPRAYYILGRFFGLLSAVVLSLIIMSALHLALLLAKGWQADPSYFLCLPFIYFKVMMVAALAVFFSLFSTSSVSSIVFTLFFWILGHFGPELSYLVKKSDNALTSGVVRGVMFLMPNFQFLNYRDVFHVPGFSIGNELWGFGYAALYAAACLALSLALFLKKEF